jgi:hypothetical protein
MPCCLGGDRIKLARIRFFLWDGLQADIGVAFPLSYRAPDNEPRNARLLFSLSNALKLCPRARALPLDSVPAVVQEFDRAPGSRPGSKLA